MLRGRASLLLKPTVVGVGKSNFGRPMRPDLAVTRLSFSARSTHALERSVTRGFGAESYVLRILSLLIVYLLLPLWRAILVR
jgi:hypothetical protein